MQISKSKRITPVVSVVIPEKNRPAYLIEAITSVYKQDFPTNRLEVFVVVDKGNNYPWRQILDLYPRVKFVSNRDMEGPGGARNTGLKFARGRYVAFLDSDDQWNKDFLSDSINNIKQYKSAASICVVKPYFVGVYPIREKFKVLLINITRFLALCYCYFFNFQKVLKNCFWIGQVSHSVFVKSKLKYFKFDYQYRRGGEDWALYVYTLNHSSISIIPKSLVRFRYEMGSSTNQKINQTMKGASYKRLLSNLPTSFKHGLGYRIFEYYVNSLQVK